MDGLSFKSKRTSAPEPDHVRAKILVVDDNSLNRKKMRMAVENLGHTAEVAKNGLEAIEMLTTASFDAVLLDILMPEMDGVDVLSEMKIDEKMRDVPVIVISALDDETESVVRAIGLGAEDFLPKSFDPVLWMIWLTETTPWVALRRFFAGWLPRNMSGN